MTHEDHKVVSQSAQRSRRVAQLVTGEELRAQRRIARLRSQNRPARWALLPARTRVPGVLGGLGRCQ